MIYLEDARQSLHSAEEALKRYEYAVSLVNVNMALERALKALLDCLNISYSRRDGKGYLHDVSELVPEAYRKLEPKLESYDKDYVRMELARAATLHKMLTPISNIGKYGFKSFAEAMEIFVSYFLEDCYQVILRRVNNYISLIERLLNKLSE